MAALEHLWREERAAALGEAELLLYRSNLLGADKRITNFGGGNTSAKIEARDPLTGEPVVVLWVKGSGGDLGSMNLEGFATLELAKLERLKALYRGPEREDEMVAYLPHCAFDLNPRAASIDTPLHAYLPYRHVDHVHPDAVIAIAASRDGEAMTERCFEGRLGWLPWRRPGFELGLQLENLARSRPELEGVVLGGHGLFTWADDAKTCYDRTLDMIERARLWLEDQGRARPFGLEATPIDEDRRRRNLRSLLPRLRGRIGAVEPKIGHVDAGDDAMAFVGSERMAELGALGTSCPDHFLRTKIRPIVLRPEMDDAALDAALAAYRADYEGYYERCRRPDSPAMRDPNPVIALAPEAGLIAFAKDKKTARVAAEFFGNAINVMRGAESVDCYVGLDEQEAFDIEYWALEEAKLQRLPKPKPMTGKIALVTGGAGGIGKATARRLLADGCVVALTDRDQAPLDAAKSELDAEFGQDHVAAFLGDVTSDADMARVLGETVERFGGLDALVCNAGLASAAPFEATTLEDWNRNMDVLAKGAFLIAKGAFSIMKTQGLGGSITVIGSKNALSASAGASAYCAAKAAAVHLARCIALEGAPFGVRANVVNPDAVLRGSRIWQGDWRRARAASYAVEQDELDEVYRKRSLLGRAVYPEDVAEAVAFLASERASKSTGNLLNVDAGNAAAFTR